MGTNKKRSTTIWEKFADFLMDIAKYVLTAILITSAFKEFAYIGGWMYLLGMVCVILLLLLSVVLFKKY